MDCVPYSSGAAPELHRNGPHLKHSTLLTAANCFKGCFQFWNTSFGGFDDNVNKGAGDASYVNVVDDND